MVHAGTVQACSWPQADAAPLVRANADVGMAADLERAEGAEADDVESAEATEECQSSSDDEAPLAGAQPAQVRPKQQLSRAPRGAKCQRCGRQALQVAEAVARERGRGKKRAAVALERAKLKRQERVAAERSKWRKILAEKLEAVRAKAAADKQRTALFWAKKAANKGPWEHLECSI